MTGGRGRIQLHITRGSGDDGDGYEFDLYIAIQQCIEAGVDIINVSIGSTGLSSMNDSLYKRVVNEHGILLIAAAGNDGDETRHFPAAHSASIAVSSVNKKGEWSSFSNNGPWIELAAPGAGIKGPTFGDSYASRSGTSFASPFVAGASAILRTHYDPKICPSVALRYALAINAVVPGARMNFAVSKEIVLLLIVQKRYLYLVSILFTNIINILILHFCSFHLTDYSYHWNQR